jgi:3',5'-cyclic-AMP phosphodiesterase
VQLGQYPPPGHVVAHVSDTHLLAADARQYGVVDPEAGLRLALDRLTRLHPA